MHDRIFKWTCLMVFIIGAYKFYMVFYEAKEETKAGLAALNANLLPLMESATTSIERVSEKATVFEERASTVLSQAKSNLEYGNRLLDRVANSGGEIGKRLPLNVLVNKMSAQKWAASARNEVKVLALSAYDKDEILYHVCTGILGGNWYIRLPDEAPVPLDQWLESVEP